MAPSFGPNNYVIPSLPLRTPVWVASAICDVEADASVACDVEADASSICDVDAASMHEQQSTNAIDTRRFVQKTEHAHPMLFH